MKNYIIAGGIIVIAGIIGVPIIPVPIDCPISYNTTLYDTPSGQMEDGYSTVVDNFVYATTTAPTPKKIAHAIGIQAYTRCFDADKNMYIYPLTQKEYSDLGLKDAGKPEKILTQSLLDIVKNAKIK